MKIKHLVPVISFLILSCHSTLLLAENSSKQVFWGDTHLHTTLSADAGMFGNTLTPSKAYRWAMGEEITSSSGLKTRISLPLDFLVISDHAENFGLPAMIASSSPGLLANDWGKKIHNMVKADKGPEAFSMWATEAMIKRNDPLAGLGLYEDIWKTQTETAEKYNQPGKFTALIGYEWTSSPNSRNLHRVVIFKDSAERAQQIMPFSQFDSNDPEDLWTWMAAYEKNTGGNILAIPHNGNVSNGLMFATERMNGKAFDADYVARRAKWEPLVETTQIKGDSEAHPFLSPEDEFADYGTWDKADIGGRNPKQDSMFQFEYSRAALKNGLALGQIHGTNPFKFGMIGATDSHTGISGTREDNYFGKFVSNEPHKGRWKHYAIQSQFDEKLSTFAYEELASGLAAVWARENTREALFEAMENKEVYATTGTRILVRMFGGWNFSEADLNSVDMASIGYKKGVPMGSDLSKASGDKAPVFMLAAYKDPMGANLDRIQIIKGWLDNAGEAQEKIYNVALSDKRKVNSDGKTEPVGNTVDLKTATYTNSIGAASLTALWRDPNFDAKQSAFYYARVLEIPTPTWQAYDQVRLKDKMPDKVTKIAQDRAYTSPIWYTP